MAIKLSKTRKFTFDYVETEIEKDENGNIVYDEKKQPKKIDKCEATFTFEFPFSEQRDYTKISDLIRKSLISDAKTEAEKAHNNDAARMLAPMARELFLRTALIDCTGLEYDNGEVIKIKNSDGTVNEHNQKIAYEFVKSTYLFSKINEASTGLSLKNSETGVMESTTMDGSQVSA